MLAPSNCAVATNELGFAIISGVLGRNDIELLLEELNCRGLPRSRAGIRHAMRLPAVSEIASASPLLEIAREILGEAAIPFHATLFDKSSTSNWLVVWHQDTALPLRGSSKSATEAPRRVLHIEYAIVRAFSDGLELAIA